MNTQETSPEEPVYFDELPLNDDVIDGITAMGFEKATPIQAAAIPPILEGKTMDRHQAAIDRQYKKITDNNEKFFENHEDSDS